MTMTGKPDPGGLHAFQTAEESSHHVIQAIEPEAEQVLVASGGKVVREPGNYHYEAYGDCCWPTLLILWPPHTQSAYVAPVGQEDSVTIFLVALLPVSHAELHLTYDYRPMFLEGPFEEFFTLRMAREQLFPSALATVPQPLAPRSAASAPSRKRGRSMDKQEAERLVRAIERTHIAWLRVDQMVLNETRNTYELKCSYRGPAGWLGAKAVWSTRWITSPREWIDLLTTQRDML